MPGTLTLTPRVPSPLTISPQFYSRAAENVFDVKDYGALGDNSTNDFAAIGAAYTALTLVGGGTLYFPPGNYCYGSALAFAAGVPLSILGAGQTVSLLRPTFATSDALTVSNSALTSIQNIGFSPTVDRNQGTYRLKLSNLSRPVLHNLYFASATGGLISSDTVSFLEMTNCQGDSNNGSAGDTCLRFKATSGTMTNCYFRTGVNASGFGRGPCLHLTGLTTSLKISNSGFVGGGPHSQYTISSVTSDAAKFTVTTSAAHDFAVGDLVAIRGCTPTGYNNLWRVATVPTGTTLTVLSLANLGTTSVNGTAESLAACVLVTNEDGPVNECQFANCIFEALVSSVYGTAALYLDGRRSTNSIMGWTISDNYYDFGTNGLVLSGKSNGAAGPTVYSHAVDGGVFSNKTRSIFLDQVSGIVISGPQAGMPAGQTGLQDGIRPSAAVYIYAGPSAPFTQGITINGGQLGGARDWTGATTPHEYGVLLENPSMEDIVITGNLIYGTTKAIDEVLTVPQTHRWTIRNNEQSNSGTTIPSVASATTLTIGFQDTHTVTGTTNIQFVNTGWVGREIRLLFTGGLSLVTGGNLAIGANRTVLAGDMVTLVFDGTSWYVR